MSGTVCLPPQATLMFFPGTAGPAGSAWHVGSEVPASSLGASGDFYINSVTGDIYKRAGEVWVYGGNIRGPIGATGAASTVPGPAGATGATGPQGPAVTPRGAMLYLNSTMAIPDATDTDVVWSGKYYDDADFWDIALPDRFIIPAGVERVRLSAGIRWIDNSTGNRKVRIRGNPEGAFEANAIWAACEHPTGTQGDCTLATGIIPVVEGDWFNVPVTQNSGAPLDLRITPPSGARGNYFCLEVIK